MAKIEIDTKYWMFIRKDIMACTFLTLQAKMILSSLLSRKKTESIRTNIDIAHSFFGLTEQETDSAFKELENMNLIDSLTLDTSTYVCSLNRDAIRHHFKGAIL